LTALVEHYRNHPALLGYDLWNKNTYNGGSANRMYCYCDASKRELREWLRARYQTVEAVGRMWNRYSYTSWDDVEPPHNFGGYPESLDWLQFRIDDAFELRASRLVQGDIGLVFVPESEMFNYVHQGSTDFYAQSIRGAYQAFFDSNIQADFVSLDGMSKYKIVYLPYPVMLQSGTVERLRKYVEDGGTLVSEGLPAYFGDHGRVGPTQPNYGLDHLFGVRERYVEFTPDLLDNLTLDVQGKTVYGRYFLQEYEPAGGSAGHYQNGHVATVENRAGKGRTPLIGTFPGGGYYRHHSAEVKAFFAGLSKIAGVEPRLRSDNGAIQARLHSGRGGNYLWVVNPTRKEAEATVDVSGVSFGSGEDVWERRPVQVAGGKVSVTIEARDAAVIALH
jgi:beta-galactosidase